jgi:hypothetical protein
MCAEASTVLRAVAVDFFFNCWYLEIPSNNRIRHIPRCVHYAQGFRLETFEESGFRLIFDVLYYLGIFSDGLRINVKILRSKRSRGPELKLGPPEYEARLLPTRQQR